MQISTADPAFIPDTIPLFIQTVLSQGADLVGSVSGGKDSDAMIRFLAKLHREQGWSGRLLALFCDLGRIEWTGVSEHLHKVCAELQIPLVKLFPRRSMIDEWQHRYETILAKQQNKPFWSSAASRFCTKHEKTQTADKLLRQFDFVVCAIGIRAEESDARAKKPRYQVRDEIASVWYKTPADCKSVEEKEAWAETAFQRWLDSGKKGRFALTWHPIHPWNLEEVWAYNGTSSADVARRTALFAAGQYREATVHFPCHWAYVSGNTRLSCSMCVLASGNDITNGAKLNPFTWAELALMEMVGGWGFQQNRWLTSLHPEVLQVTWTQRDRLLQSLYDLKLVDRWNQIYVLNLLQHCSVEHILFWQHEVFEAVAAAIAQH